MAHPSHFPEANLDLYPGSKPGAPPGAQYGGVIPLRVCRQRRIMVSRWELTPAERAEVERTGVVWLAVAADTDVPPVLVTGLKEDALSVGEDT